MRKKSTTKSTTTVKKKKAVKKTKIGRPSGSNNTYPVNMSGAIRDVIEKRQKFINKKEIFNYLSKEIKKVGGKIEDQKKFEHSASILILSLQSREQIAILPSPSGSRIKFYGKPKWVNKKGKALPKFAPK